MRYQSASTLPAITAAGILVLVAGTTNAGVIESNWLSAQSGVWSNSLFWSTDPAPNNGTPNAGDTYRAVINAAGAPYTVSMQSAVALDELEIDSDDVTLDQLAALTIERGLLNRGTHRVGSGATFTINDEYQVGGDLDFAGAHLLGLGSLQVLAGGSGRFTGDILQSTTVHNAGSIVHDDASFLYFSTSELFNAPGATLTTSGANVVYEAVLDPIDVTSEGLLIRSEAGTTIFDGAQIGSTAVRLNNTGEVRAEAGQIILRGGGNSSGLFHADAGASIEFENRHTFEDGASFEGAGETRFGEGDYSFNGATTNTTSMIWDNARIETLGNFTNDATMRLTATRTPINDPGGQVDNNAGAEITLISSSLRTYIVNAGLITATDSSIRVEDNLSSGEIILNNAGATVKQNEGLIRLNSGGAGYQNTFENTGIIRVNGGSSYIEDIDNTGSIFVESGDLTIYGNLGGQVQVSNGATLIIEEGSDSPSWPLTTIGSNLVVEQGGLLLSDFGKLAVESLDGVAGEAHFRGEVHFLNDIDIDSRFSFLEGNSLEVDGDLRFVDDNEIPLFAAHGAGSIEVVPGAALELNSVRVDTYINTEFTNSGTLNISRNTQVEVGRDHLIPSGPSSGNLINTPSGVINLDARTRLNGLGADHGIVNAGVINASGEQITIGPVATIDQEPVLMNTGTINVLEGDMEIWSRAMLGGDVHVEAGASLRLWASVQPADGSIVSSGALAVGGLEADRGQSFVANGSIISTGSLLFRQGEIVVNSDLSLDGEVTFLNSLIDGDGSFRLNEIASFEQASIRTVGSVEITENAMAAINAGQSSFETDLAVAGELRIDAASSIDMTGALSFDADSILSVEHDFGVRGIVPTIDVNGPAAIGGALVVTAPGMPEPVPGQGFTLLTATSITGVFTGHTLPEIDESFSWDIAYGTNSITLTVIPAPSGIALAPVALVFGARRRRITT